MYATIEEYDGYNAFAPCSGCTRRCYPVLTNMLMPAHKKRQQCCNEKGNGCFSISGLGGLLDDYYCCGRRFGSRTTTSADRQRNP